MGMKIVENQSEIINSRNRSSVISSYKEIHKEFNEMIDEVERLESQIKNIKRHNDAIIDENDSIKSGNIMKNLNITIEDYDDNVKDLNRIKSVIFI